MTPNVNSRLALIQQALARQVRPLCSTETPFVLFFSVSDGTERARVVTGTGRTLDDAWAMGTRLLRERMQADQLSGKWIRLDWVDRARFTTWAEIDGVLAHTKRNYFRWGIALDRQFRAAFTEQELNANAMLYGGNGIHHAVLNPANFAIYARQRFGSGLVLDFSPLGEIVLFSTQGLFCDEQGKIHELPPQGADTGRRTVEMLDSDRLCSIISDASAYLARQVSSEGRFTYGYHPCFDRPIQTYNALRHASSTYALLEAYELNQDPDVGAAAGRAIGYLTAELIKQIELPDGTEAAFLVDTGNEIKLGGSAVAILALAKFALVHQDLSTLPLMRRLALGICFMQDRDTGGLTHVLDFPSLAVRQQFRTIYYDGEAAFAMMRLYEIDGDERWLAFVERAFADFIAQQHWKHHDHWLGYCVNELTRYRPEERYFRFAIQNVADHLDFVENRVTTFPTLLELMMATQQAIARIAAEPGLAHLLDDIDLPHFEQALEKRAQHLLNGHFWPELAMYFRKPDRIVGSFFIRHHGFRVRIDDVEHYLSGLIAYRAYLPRREAFRKAIADRSRPKVREDMRPGWTAHSVAAATGGEWIQPPPPDWGAAGVSTFAPACRGGDLAVIKSGAAGIGIGPQLVPRMAQCSGLISAEPTALPQTDLPVLRVRDTGQAVLAMAEYARARMVGKIVGVTGSAGKTTVVAMLASALSPAGPVNTTQHNANLPNGVAWNLASFDWTAPHAVLELAVGRMALSARLAQPQVAIFTNVLPAHLREGTTTADIARTKSAIFMGMNPGDVAVLNRDMEELAIVQGAAEQRGLKLVWFGTSPGCDLQLLDYDALRKIVHARINGRLVRYRLGAPGRHMAINSLAVLGAVTALGHPLEPALAQLAGFNALAGRGATFSASIGGRQVTIIDDAYNANPGSMRAALAGLAEQSASRRRVAVLGDMAELGPRAVDYHSDLAAVIAASAIDKVFVSGHCYGGLWAQLPAMQRGRLFADMDELEQELRHQLEDGDIVLFKASHSSGLHKLVDRFRNGEKRAPAAKLPMWMAPGLA